jgi:hypothetical protein
MRPDGPRDPVAGPDSGPEPPFPIKLSGPVIRGFGRGSKEVCGLLSSSSNHEPSSPSLARNRDLCTVHVTNHNFMHGGSHLDCMASPQQDLEGLKVSHACRSETSLNRNRRLTPQLLCSPAAQVAHAWFCSLCIRLHSRTQPNGSHDAGPRNPLPLCLFHKINSSHRSSCFFIL